ncbi:MAG: penicillin-binding protein activator LpoB [Candidatus Eisenbacteria bacterium]
MKKLMVIGICLGLVFGLSCQKKVVTRLETDEVTDLSGRWNDTDSRMVSETMVKDCLNHPWLSEHMRDVSKRPVVIVGIVRNKSSEHINVTTFISDIERAYINSGLMDVVASAIERTELREEKADQSRYADEETVKEFGMELGADYMLNGYISTIIDQEEKTKAVYYQVDLTLTDIQTNRKVWIGQEKIKKLVEHKRFSS